ncbi:MAG: DUF5719 family protein [Bifidobacteriaceae bacterium]|jgi:hypothetical protein|nr:DUF5719 family protein [Bifidobacteriaceae bacterium]
MAGWLRRAGSIVCAAALVAAAGALVWADREYPAGAAGRGEPELVEVPPGDSVAVCPGALSGPTEGEGEVVYDPRFDPEPTFVQRVGRAVVEGSAGGRLEPLGEDASTQLAGPLAVATYQVGVLPTRVDAASDSDIPALAAGGVFQHLGDGDLRGVAAAPCVAPAGEAWIVAGSTEPGSSARLLAANAGYTTVTAALEVWDAAGRVDAIGLEGLVIPPRSQRAVRLEGFVGNAARLAVHVTAQGGELAVFLQHSRLEGLVQGGVELAVPGEPPSQAVTVPGISVTESDFDTARTSAVRVVNPGPVEAQVSVELWGPDGRATLPGLEETRVGPGLVTDLSLGGLPAGRYVAVVSSDQPVAAAGLSLRAGGADKPEEFAWSNSAAPEDHSFVPLPEGDLEATLVAGADEDTTLLVTPLAKDGTRGDVERVEVAAGSAEALTPEDLGAEGAAALELAWDGPPGYAALNVSAKDDDGELISALTPRGRWADAASIRVYPLR